MYRNLRKIWRGNGSIGLIIYDSPTFCLCIEKMNNLESSSNSTESVKSNGFTVLELLVALSVTAVLAGLLLTISVQILNTQRQSALELETNQIAQFVLDRIQEDLQCALFRNDGNAWMEISIRHPLNPDWQDPENPNLAKPDMVRNLWAKESIPSSTIEGGKLEDARFGKTSTWLRFFTQAPDFDIDSNNSGGARAIGYQIIRHGITSSPSSSQRYHLFRSDVSEKNTFVRGYNLTDYSENPHQDENANTLRLSSRIRLPIISDPTQVTAFSLATNIVDFGVRAYAMDFNNSYGSAVLTQLFPTTETDAEHSFRSKRSPKPIDEEGRFPDCVDVMIRVLSSEGAKILERYEKGLVKKTNDLSNEDYWWELVEKHSEVFIRRIKIYGQGI